MITVSTPRTYRTDGAPRGQVSPPGTRAIAAYRLFTYEAWTYARISKHFDVSLKTVASWLERVRNSGESK